MSRTWSSGRSSLIFHPIHHHHHHHIHRPTTTFTTIQARATTTTTTTTSTISGVTTFVTVSSTMGTGRRSQSRSGSSSSSGAGSPQPPPPVKTEPRDNCNPATSQAEKDRVAELVTSTHHSSCSTAKTTVYRFSFDSRSLPPASAVQQAASFPVSEAASSSGEGTAVASPSVSRQSSSPPLDQQSLASGTGVGGGHSSLTGAHGEDCSSSETARTANVGVIRSVDSAGLLHQVSSSRRHHHGALSLDSVNPSHHTHKQSRRKNVGPFSHDRTVDDNFQQQQQQQTDTSGSSFGGSVDSMDQTSNSQGAPMDYSSQSPPEPRRSEAGVTVKGGAHVGGEEFSGHGCEPPLHRHHRHHHHHHQSGAPHHGGGGSPHHHPRHRHHHHPRSGSESRYRPGESYRSGESPPHVDVDSGEVQPQQYLHVDLPVCDSLAESRLVIDEESCLTTTSSDSDPQLPHHGDLYPSPHHSDPQPPPHHHQGDPQHSQQTSNPHHHHHPQEEDPHQSSDSSHPHHPHHTTSDNPADPPQLQPRSAVGGSRLLEHKGLGKDEKLVAATLATLNQSMVGPSNIIKQDLRLVIQSRRKAEGKEELTVQFKEPAKEEMSEEEWQRSMKRRDQNRRAAQRFRHKQRQMSSSLAGRVRQLEAMHCELQRELATLQGEKRGLLHRVHQHSQVCKDFDFKIRLQQALGTHLITSHPRTWPSGPPSHTVS